MQALTILTRSITAWARLLFCAAGLLAVSRGSLLSQVRATDEVQQKIELVVAPAVREYNKAAFSGWALEPRMRVAGFPTLVASKDKGVAVSTTPDIQISWEWPASHDTDHLARIAKLLGVDSTLSDKPECAKDSDGEEACRYAGFPGVVVFGPAWLTGDAASILVQLSTVVERRLPDGTKREHVSGAALMVTCVVSAGAWKVNRISRISF